MSAVNGPFFLIFAALLYILPLVLLVLWMIKILKNSNENLKIQREILQKLTHKD